MAELVAEAFLSAMFEKLFEKLTSKEFVNLFRGKKSIDDQLKQLNQKLKKASGLLNDAEEKQLEDSKVKEWLDELKDVIYRAQDLMDEIDYEAQSKKERESEANTSVLTKMKSFFPSWAEFDKTVQGEMAKILEDLDFLLIDNEVANGLKEGAYKNNTTGTSLPRQIAPWREERYVHGRDAEKEEIMELLLSNDAWGGKIGVLPIVGLGGLGKTTLAQLIYDDHRWKEHGYFERKPWVTVSTNFDTLKIMKSILTQVNPSSTCGDEEQMLQRALKEALRCKKFLIVLDDVWDDNYHKWDVLKSIFEFGELESRVIVTTRSHTVASTAKTGPIHDLQRVPDDHCWKIFMDHAFNGDSNADPSLQEIGKGIVKKCGGLPLAVTSLGGLLRSLKDPKEWERILKSRAWECCNEILPSLWLSYRYLPSYLKHCFAYCSVFPKDYKFQKEEIILLWMAEGFLQTDKKRKRIEEVGEEYFDNLISRSLFQRSSQEETEFVMHDLVHDLAMFVSGEFCLAVDDNKISLELLTNKTRHLSSTIIIYNYDSMKEGLSRAKHLRTFIGRNIAPSDLEQKILSSDLRSELIKELLGARRCLIRVLYLRRSSLPNSISKLKHLRYLDLSYSDKKEILCSVCTLYNLQTLLLSYCKNLTRLPNNLGRLSKLRHLDTTDSPLEEMPPWMGNLTELQTLTDFVLGDVHDNASSIKELGKLPHLGGALRISGLQNVANVKEVQEAKMRYKEKLTELIFEWQGDSTDTKREMEVLDALQPHTNLKKLTICSYGGFNFPNWIGDSSLSNIVTIHLSDNKYCWSLPPLGQLSSLQKLVIKGFHGVETIGAEFYGNNSFITPFKSLKTLCFLDMPEWKQWSIIGGERDGGAFPSLKNLHLKGCSNLTGSLPNLDSLKTLQISGTYPEFGLLAHPDLQYCKKLEFPGSHRYVSVREMTINYCDSLKSLPLDYFPSLKELRLSNCWNIESLTLSEEGDTEKLCSLSCLEIWGCENFRSLPQYMHRILPSLAILEFSGCPEIESFPEGGLPLSLKQLSIKRCNKLVAQHRHWDLQRLTSLNKLEIGGYNEVFDSFPEGLLPLSLTHLSLKNLPKVQKLNGSAFQDVASLQKLDLWRCIELQDFPEQVLCTSLRSLEISWCPILEKRYQPEKGEDWHKISYIPTIEIHP